MGVPGIEKASSASFSMLLFTTVPGEAADGIEEPDVLDAHGEVVVDALLQLGEGVAGREDLDAEERGGADDALGGPAKGQDANVGNAEAGSGGLDALLGEGAGPARPFGWRRR